MKAAYSGTLTGLVKEMDQEARNEARYTGQMYKGIAIPNSKSVFLFENKYSRQSSHICF